MFSPCPSPKLYHIIHCSKTFINLRHKMPCDSLYCKHVWWNGLYSSLNLKHLQEEASPHVMKEGGINVPLLPPHTKHMSTWTNTKTGIEREIHREKTRQKEREKRWILDLTSIQMCFKERNVRHYENHLLLWTSDQQVFVLRSHSDSKYPPCSVAMKQICG